MTPLSPLEHAVVELTARSAWPGFQLDGLSVVRREYTGVGAFIYVDDAHRQVLPDGHFTGPREKVLYMLGVNEHLDYEICVSSGRIEFIELATCAADGWDGAEREWRFETPSAIGE